MRARKVREGSLTSGNVDESAFAMVRRSSTADARALDKGVISVGRSA